MTRILFLLILLPVSVVFSQNKNPLPHTHYHDFTNDSLDQVVVTGTMRVIKRTASPVPVEVYSPKFFMKNPTPTLFDAMQMVNGVRPQLNCNICNTGDIHINGLEGPYTMVLIDGMPIVSSLASVYGLSGIPNSLVERIEVVKGPASSLYGSEAIGGLINVITKTPDKAPLLAVDFSGTAWQEYNTDIGLKYKPGTNSTALLGINYFKYGNPADKNKDNFTDVTLQDRISVFNKISWNRKGNRMANVALRYVYEDRWGGEMNWNKGFRGGDSVYGESIYTSRLEVIGNYQLPVKEKMVFSYSVNRHDQNSVYGAVSFNARQQVAFSQLTWEKEIDKHTLLFGTVARYTWYDDNTPATFDSVLLVQKADKILLPGVFMQDEITLNKKQQLLLGVRYDYDKRHGNILTPRVAYKISPTSRDILRINAGTGFRVVNIFTEDHAALTGARDVVIAGKLKPERSYNVNLNYLKKIYSGNFSINMDLSAWYTHFTNRIVPDYTTNSNQIIYNNLDGYSVSKGMSANFEYGHKSSLRITAGATFMDVSLTNRDITGKSKRSRQLLTEKWAGTWTVSYMLPVAGINIDYTGNIYGPMLLPLLSDRDPRAAKSPAWSIQNIQVTKKFLSDFEVYGGIKNLLNWTPAKHTPFIIARANDPFDKHLDTDNPYGLTFDPNYVYAPNQGIRGFLGIRYTLKN
jgi:outer membrane receptor for ferrienterochelin and colicins